MSIHKSSTNFMKQMVQLYKAKNNKAIQKQFKNLFDKGDESSIQQWETSFNFGPYTKIDNVCGIYFNILQAIQHWQVQRLSGLMEKSNSFENYLVVLKMGLFYLDKMSKNNIWFAPCIKYLVLKAKFAMKQANNAGCDNITKTKSLEKLVQILRDFKSSNNVQDDIKKMFKLMINNLLVSCYLSIRDYIKSKKIIDDRQIIKDLASFSRPQINNYQFQSARLQIHNKTISKAIKSLQSIKFTTNRQRNLILKYLIPCNLYAWKIPQTQIYPQYSILSKAIISGNFGQFNSIFNKYKMVWIQRGIYQLILGLEVFVWRNFLKRTQKYLQQQIISIRAISNYTKLMGGQFSSQDCLSCITNLIVKQYIKAHIYVTPDGQKSLVFKIKRGDVFPKRKPD